MKTRTAVLVAGIASLLAGCSTYQTPSPSQGMPTYSQASVVDGQWLDQNGIVSSFSNGQFETRTADTNQMLASGTYTDLGNNVIEIDLTSVIRQTKARVNCAVVSAYLMNCTPNQGAQFQLYKPAAAPPGYVLPSAAAAASTAGDTSTGASDMPQPYTPPTYNSTSM
ncbi:hypothetical protein [Martelella sp. HB161492]|uniref:hypothetical protein n=1 Tax=Martelella sp. HB161492 TaxID=2720726 RepID=UPI00158FC046|nr:hypothetical protein [Martelella sp. HB161492]